MLKKLTIMALLSMLIACSKKKPVQFVAGDVLTGIKAGTPIDSVFALFNNLGLQMKEVNDFKYLIPYSPDKLDSINAYLNTKRYIDTMNWKVKLQYNQSSQQAIYFTHFFHMDSQAQADWLLTVKQLGLIELKDSFASVYLRVPDGKEQYWVNELSKNNMIRWAELNQIINVNLN